MPRKPRRATGDEGKLPSDRSEGTPAPNGDGKKRKGRVERVIIPPSRICASAAELLEERVSFLWTGRIPERSVTLLAGPSDQGKSTIATAVAAAVTAGARLPGGPDLSPRGVLWYGAEEYARTTTRPRLRAAGAVLGRVFLPELDREGAPRPRPRLPRDAGAILEMARTLDAGLIVLDPISAYVESELNPDFGSTARAVLQSLAEICLQADTSVLAIKHPRKASGHTAPIEQISGSREWTNHPRSVLVAAPHPDRAEVSCLACVKFSLGRKPRAICYQIAEREGAPVVSWLDEVDLTPDQLMEAAGSPGERDALADARGLLIDRLTSGEQRTKDLLRWAEESGVSVGTLRRAKKALNVTSHTIGPSESRYHVWRAPAGGFPNGAAT